VAVGEHLRHPWRFSLVAACLGVLFSFALHWWAQLAWGSFPELGLFIADGVLGAILFAATASCVAYLLRRRIAESRGTAALGLSVVCTWIGGGVYMLFLMTYALARDLVLEGAAEEWAGWLETSVVLIMAPMLGMVFATLLVPVAVPLAWASILLLREAGGGLVRGEHAPLRVAQT